MLPDPLRILILEDVPMDAELVEYELERARIPFVSRRVDSRDGLPPGAGGFQPRPDPLGLYPAPFDGMSALSLARERAPSIPFLIVTGSVNEETAVGCMKAGATDYLLKSNLARIGPAIEAALERERAHAEKIQSRVGAGRQRATIPLPGAELLRPGHHPRPRRHRSSMPVTRPSGSSGTPPATLVGTSLLDYLRRTTWNTVRALLQNGDGTSSGPGPSSSACGGATAPRYGSRRSAPTC